MGLIVLHLQKYIFKLDFVKQSVKPANLHEVLQVFRSMEILKATNETESVLRLVTERVFQISPMECQLAENRGLTTGEFETITKIIKQLKQHVPIQYILGTADFYDLEFYVNPSVLIPRQETEELVHWILQDTQNKSLHLNLVDLGTGSGCIPIALKKHLPNATVYGLDIATPALQTANRNALHNRCEVQFYRADVLKKPEMPFEKADIIVSNPPYVTQKEKVEIQPRVLDNEPHQALFVSDDDPLIFYREIGKLAKNYLADSGSLYFEINQYLGDETVSLLTDLGYVVELRKDLNGNNRMIKAKFKA